MYIHHPQNLSAPNGTPSDEPNALCTPYEEPRFTSPLIAPITNATTVNKQEALPFTTGAVSPQDVVVVIHEPSMMQQQQMATAAEPAATTESSGSNTNMKRKREQWEQSETSSKATGEDNGAELDSERQSLGDTGTPARSQLGKEAREEKRAKLGVYNSSTTVGPTTGYQEQKMTLIQPAMQSKSPFISSQQMAQQQHQQFLQQQHPLHLQQHHPQFIPGFPVPPPTPLGQPALTQPLYGPPGTLRTSNSDVYRARQEAYAVVVKNSPSSMHHHQQQQLPPHSHHPSARMHPSYPHHQQQQQQQQQQPQMHHIQIQHIHKTQQQHHTQQGYSTSSGASHSLMGLTEECSGSEGMEFSLSAEDLMMAPTSQSYGHNGHSSSSPTASSSSCGQSGQSPTKKPPKEKKQAKVASGERVDITHLLKYPQSQAAQLLNMSQATFSKRFREANNKRWPYRRLIVLEKQLKTAMNEGDRASAEALEAATKQLLSGCFIFKK